MKLKRPAALEDDYTEGLILIDAEPDGKREARIIGKPTKLALLLLALAVFGLTSLLIIGLWPIPKP